MRRNTVALFAGTVICLLLMAEVGSALAGSGRVFNSGTDVDWMSVFPIKIGCITVASLDAEDTETVGMSPICFCSDSDRLPPLNILPSTLASVCKAGRTSCVWDLARYGRDSGPLQGDQTEMVAAIIIPADRRPSTWLRIVACLRPACHVLPRFAH